MFLTTDEVKLAGATGRRIEQFGLGGWDLRPYCRGFGDLPYVRSRGLGVAVDKYGLGREADEVVLKDCLGAG